MGVYVKINGKREQIPHDVLHQGKQAVADWVAERMRSVGSSRAEFAPEERASRGKRDTGTGGGGSK